jgi:molybdate transport system substrate-binding protein
MTKGERGVTRKTAMVNGFAAGGAIILAACGSSAAPSSSGSAASAPALTGTVTVFAASSLTGTFTTLGHEFEQAHPGTTVKFSFGGSDTLAAQIVSGAPADVFASAAPQTMGTVKSAGLIAGNPTVFARNQLELAVPPGNPLNLHTLSDINQPTVKLALCAKTVPCGSAALAAFAVVGITPHPVTLELDVKSVLTKVELGEVDAGVVYKTDVQAAGGKVTGVAFPEAGGAINKDPIAALKNSANLSAAQAFVAFVLSAQGRSVFAAAGFLSAS